MNRLESKVARLEERQPTAGSHITYHEVRDDEGQIEEIIFRVPDAWIHSGRVP